jgi:serine/threonine protein kinase
MFSGQLPYSGRPLEVLAKHREGGAPPVSKLNESMPGDVSALIVKMMAVDPLARPQSMLEVRDQVKKLLDAK